MLKNTMDILASQILCSNRDIKVACDMSNESFSSSIDQSCGKVRDAWTAAAFSDCNDEALRRYFNFQFRLLSGVIGTRVNGSLLVTEKLYSLMDHLLYFFSSLIDQVELIPQTYAIYRLMLVESKFQGLIEVLATSEVSRMLQECIVKSLSPLYTDPAPSMTLGHLLYRETLLSAILSKTADSRQLNDESLIASLIGYNFNHFLFFRFLCECTKNRGKDIDSQNSAWQVSLLTMSLPDGHPASGCCFDTNWPHIAVMYRSWLADFRMLAVEHRSKSEHINEKVKIPLNISVKYLACLIRALYASGYYGNISLTAIFHHTAACFTTKRQQNLSADSLSNAYYDITDVSAIKVNRLLSRAMEFLKPYCYPA